MQLMIRFYSVFLFRARTQADDSDALPVKARRPTTHHSFNVRKTRCMLPADKEKLFPLRIFNPCDVTSVDSEYFDEGEHISC
jgi:hypothetical protein